MPVPAARPPVAHEPLSVVLVAGGDESEIEAAVHGWGAYLQTLQRPFEILVVDHGCAGLNRQAIEACVGEEPHACFLSQEKPPGAGAALRTALGCARFPLFFYGSCSRSCQPAGLAALLELIDQVDVVCGYRAHAGRPLKLPAPDRRYSWYVRLLFGIRVRDVDCPFKLFRREVFSRIPIQSDGPFVHAEILAKANFLGCLMAEAPVQWDPPQLAATPPLLRKLRRKEAWHVFRHPDFGPAHLKADAPPQNTGSDTITTCPPDAVAKPMP
jgi:hypothetical protein